MAQELPYFALDIPVSPAHRACIGYGPDSAPGVKNEIPPVGAVAELALGNDVFGVISRLVWILVALLQGYQVGAVAWIGFAVPGAAGSAAVAESGFQRREIIGAQATLPAGAFIDKTLIRPVRIGEPVESAAPRDIPVVPLCHLPGKVSHLLVAAGFRVLPAYGIGNFVLVHRLRRVVMQHRQPD